MRATPNEIVVVEGLAIAVYPDDSTVPYAALDELLADHGLAISTTSCRALLTVHVDDGAR